jgi:hypothetical protein
MNPQLWVTLILKGRFKPTARWPKVISFRWDFEVATGLVLGESLSRFSKNCVTCEKDVI